MALTVNIQKPVFNLTTGKFNLTDNTAGTPVLTKGVFRITAPDGNFYYSATNNSSTFTTPNSSPTPDITTAGAISLLISIPLDSNGEKQLGLYRIDYNVFDGTTNYAMTQSVISFSFAKPTVVSTQYVDCVNAKLTATDTTNYTVATVIPTITRTHTLTKDNALPSVYSFSTSSSSIILASPSLYSGTYTSSVSTVAIYSFLTYDVNVTLIGSLAGNMITCNKNICEVFCGIKTLEMNLEDAKSRGNSVQIEALEEKLQSIASYIILFNTAVKCGDIPKANQYLVEMKTIGGFTDNCCSTVDNFQILPYVTGGSITVQDEGATLTTTAELINVTGAGATATVDSTGKVVTINVPSTVGANFDVKDEGSLIKNNPTSIDFVGAGVVVDLNGGQPRVTIDGATAGNVVYDLNTTIGTTQTVGGVLSGTTFVGTTLLKQVVYQMLNPFINPSFGSLTSTIFTTYELGQAVPLNTYAIGYSVNNFQNVIAQPPNIGIPSTDLTATFPINPFQLLASGTFNLVISVSNALTSVGSKLVSLQGKNSQGQNFTVSGYLLWKHKVYFGSSATDLTLNSANVLAFGSVYKDSPNGTYSFSATGAQYRYITIPDSIGSPSSFKDDSTNLGVAMTSGGAYSNTANGYNYALITFTNTYGQSYSMRVYRTANQIVPLNIIVS